MDENLNPNDIAYYAVPVFNRYLNHLFGYVDGHTYVFERGVRLPVDHVFLREMEECIGIPPELSEDYRRRQVSGIYRYLVRFSQTTIRWDWNDRLKTGILKYLNAI